MPAALLPPPPRHVPDPPPMDPEAEIGVPVTTLICCQAFPAPIPMGALLNSVFVDPVFSLPVLNGSVYSGQLTQAQIVAMLAALKTTLAGVTKVALFTNNVVPSLNTAWSALTEPTGTWYAQVATVLGTEYTLPDGTIGLRGTSCEFDYSGSSAAQNIVGWALISVVGS